MAQREGDEVENVEGEEEIVHTNGTENRLKALEEAQGNNQAKEALTQLVADPQIAAIIQARRAGKSVKIVDDVEEVVEEPDPVEAVVKDMPEDDPQRQLISTISKLTEAKTEKVVSKLMEKIEQLESQLAETAEVTTSVKRDKVTQAVAEARSKYKDFDQYKDKMLELSKENPGLSVADLYIVAKNRSGKLRQVETITETEKPTSQPRRVAKPGSTPKRSPGRQGFSEMLSDAFSRVSFEASED